MKDVNALLKDVNSSLPESSVSLNTLKEIFNESILLGKKLSEMQSITYEDLHIPAAHRSYSNSFWWIKTKDLILSIYNEAEKSPKRPLKKSETSSS